MARRGRRPEDNVFPFDAARRHDFRPAAPPEASPMETGLAIALLSAPQLAQELIVHWLKQVASPCSVTIVHGPAELFALPMRFDLIVVGHCLHPGPSEQLLDTVQALRGVPTPLVVLAGSEDSQLVGEALRYGVRGYIPTRLPLPVAVAAIKLVLSGGTYAPPIMPSDLPCAAELALAQPPTAIPDSPPPPAAAVDRLKLSPREGQVLRLLRVGCSNRQIAGELAISENTVMVHVRHLLRKLGVTNRTQAVYKASKVMAEGE